MDKARVSAHGAVPSHAFCEATGHVFKEPRARAPARRPASTVVRDLMAVDVSTAPGARVHLNDGVFLRVQPLGAAGAIGGRRPCLIDAATPEKDCTSYRICPSDRRRQHRVRPQARRLAISGASIPDVPSWHRRDRRSATAVHRTLAKLGKSMRNPSRPGQGRWRFWAPCPRCCRVPASSGAAIDRQGNVPAMQPVPTGRLAMRTAHLGLRAECWVVPTIATGALDSAYDRQTIRASRTGQCPSPAPPIPGSPVVPPASSALRLSQRSALFA
jgi:hypothetical protein